MLIALEQTPKGKRGFAASYASMGAAAGAALATLAMSAATLLPDEQFLAWGWRIQFLLSAALVALALIIGLKVSESPLFQNLEREADRRRMPILEVFTRHPRQLTLGILAGVAQFTMACMVTVWAVGETVVNGADKTGVLNAKALAAIVMLLATFVSARICDRFGCKNILLIGIVAGMAAAFPILHPVESGTVGGYTTAVFLGQGFMFGPLAAFIAEMFPTRVSYTGSSNAYQASSTIGAGFTPMIAAAITAVTASGVILGVCWITVLTTCAIAVLVAPECRKHELTDI